MNLELLFISDNSFVAEHAFKVLDVLGLELPVEGVPVGLFGLQKLLSS